MQKPRRLPLLSCLSQAIAAARKAFVLFQELAQALQYVETILAHLQMRQLDRTDEALYVYMTCHAVLVATQDPRAAELHRCAHDQLQSRAATLPDDEARQQFWSALNHADVLNARPQAY